MERPRVLSRSPLINAALVVTSADICSKALASPGDPRFLELQKKYTEEMRRMKGRAS